MAKYSVELKLKIVQEYLSGQGGVNFLAQKYHIKSSTDIQKWVSVYKSFGVSGLQRKRQNRSYSPQFKRNAVNLYLTSEKSYREVAGELGINNPPLITRWVLDYREKGELAFSNMRGRPRKEVNVSKSKPEKSEENKVLTKLKEENLQLRIENEWLKGLRRLRMEQRAKENPDSSQAFKDNSGSPSNPS